MIKNNSDVSWRELGKKDPYYGVLSDDRFRDDNLGAENRAHFFDTGRSHIERVLAIAHKRCGGVVSQKSALDFGCGVGRLVIPLAQVFQQVTGVDISPAMLEEAKRNCTQHDVRNVNFAISDDGLTHVTGRFDFIHCYLVLQHIPRHRGEQLVAQLLNHLGDEGILAIHFPFSCTDSSFRKSVQSLRSNFWPFAVLANLVRRRPWNEPFVQMNMYNVNRMFSLLSKYGIKDVFSEVVSAGGFVSVFIFAKKPTHPAGTFEGEHLWAADLGV